MISTAWAQGAGGGGDIFSAFLPLILIFVIFYFLLIRPQQKRQKEHRAKIEAAAKGDTVVSGGGVMGTVDKVTEEGILKVRIAEGVVIDMARHLLADVIPKQSRKKAATQKDASAKQEPLSGLGRLLGAKKEAPAAKPRSKTRSTKKSTTK